MWPYVVCKAMLGKIPYIKKRNGWFINVSPIFINDISRYIATSYDLKKRAKVSFKF